MARQLAPPNTKGLTPIQVEMLTLIAVNGDLSKSDLTEFYTHWKPRQTNKEFNELLTLGLIQKTQYRDYKDRYTYDFTKEGFKRGFERLG